MFYHKSTLFFVILLILFLFVIQMRFFCHFIVFFLNFGITEELKRKASDVSLMDVKIFLVLLVK